MFKKDSWQEEMVAKCRSRLAIESRAGRSILFYSQLPDGQVDKASYHGGCPVLNGTKVSQCLACGVCFLFLIPPDASIMVCVQYAANLWVWNTPRPGYSGNPRNPRYKGP